MGVDGMMTEGIKVTSVHFLRMLCNWESEVSARGFFFTDGVRGWCRHTGDTHG